MVASNQPTTYYTANVLSPSTLARVKSSGVSLRNNEHAGTPKSYIHSIHIKISLFIT